jgi:dethiobiotin synthetase
MLLSRIKDGFTHLATRADFTLLEGSGHMGVGSIANLNNAQVAGALGLEVVIIAPGGLGISFDQLALNKALLEKHGARLRGVILNKVEPAKYDMVKDYYSRQLKVEPISNPSAFGIRCENAGKKSNLALQIAVDRRHRSRCDASDGDLTQQNTIS